MNLNFFKKNNKFLMLAVDHRGSFKKVVNSKDPESVSQKEIVEAKMMIIETLADQVSGILVDVKTGLPAYQLVESAHDKSMLLAIEKTGYLEKNNERLTQLEHSVNELKKLGAKAVKILIYFNPFSETSHKQLETARKVLYDCKANNFPLFLEIVTYHTDQSIEKRINLVIESVKRFLTESIRADVFKIEYPGSEKACREITHMLKKIPWILLTRGENFNIFKYQLQVAVQHGCQGFLAGRALWQELGQYQGEERKKFLTETVRERFKKISAIVLK